MKVTKVHKVLAFSQEPFAKTYIEDLAEKRKKATSKIQKNQLKFMANINFGNFTYRLFHKNCKKYFMFSFSCLLGKSIENVRGRLETTMVRSERKLATLARQGNYQSLHIMSERNVLVNSASPIARLNKAYAVGFVILERSKLIMYNEYFNILQPAFPDMKISTSDTDSFIFHTSIEGGNLTKKLFELRDHFDFSNLSPKHPLYNNEHQNQLFRWKIELGFMYKILAAVSLKSKMYSLKLAPSEYNDLPKSKLQSEMKTLKGVPKTVVKTKIHFENYLMALLKKKKYSAVFTKIACKNHTLRTIRQQKLALSSFDDKRFVFDCRIHTVPYGSFHIRNKFEKCHLCN